MFTHYANVIEELVGEPIMPAAEQIARARQTVVELEKKELDKLIADIMQRPTISSSDETGAAVVLPTRQLAKALKLNAEAVPENAKGSQAAQGALRALATTVQRLAELRNELGTGHARNRPSNADTRHARLAFSAAAAMSEFLLDTWHERRRDS